ncbi:MAG: SDR family NAD(P)-dependent oxidoreductase, partial [Clostridia bacterium]|nr:SDR family NAD(P)-dependent oxidoreductase [Clostridia bacterium]
MKIAIITGASSGLGVEFAKEIDRIRGDINEIWLIARREEKLRELATLLNKPCKIIPIDITDESSLLEYKKLLEESNSQVKLLINNAGFGKLGDFAEISTEHNTGMVRLNCEALTAVTSITLPFMC